MNTALLCLLYS